jgi:hypothetical protein
MIYAFLVAMAICALFVFGMFNAANGSGPGDIRAGNAIVCFMGAAASGAIAFVLLLIAAFS